MATACNTKANNAPDTKGWMQQNVRNLPLTSIALAGILGAGIVALCNYTTTARDNKGAGI